ncbi:MAG: NADAR family protein [Synergistaceae bacterium]|nr:NADAR family protein [Synergistaceae bacterium]
MEVIARFREEYEFLSNFYEVPVTFEGLTYGSSEAAFQAQKSSDPSEREKFTALRPNDSKKAGREIQLRPDWEEVKVSVMEGILRAKFTQNPDLMEKLSATNQALLVEGNNWKDTFWGFDVNLGYGGNMLGQLLMKIRAEHQGKLKK